MCGTRLSDRDAIYVQQHERTEDPVKVGVLSPESLAF